MKFGGKLGNEAAMRCEEEKWRLDLRVVVYR